MRLRQLIAGALGASVLALVTAPVTATAAAADPKEAAGIRVDAKNGADQKVWLGQYVVTGKKGLEKAFCVNFAVDAPGSTTKFDEGAVLTDKWGGKLPQNELLDVSYLLMTYGTKLKPDNDDKVNTEDDKTAAAIAHILHTWTAPAGKGHSPDAGDQGSLAYDPNFYKNQLVKSGAANRVKELLAEATRNRGPWEVQFTPSTQNNVNQTSNWQVKLVSKTTGNPISNQPITLAPTNAKLNSTSVTTNAQGVATVAVTPTSTTPSIKATAASPTAEPKMQHAHDPSLNVQKVVIGGGTTDKSATATIKPGGVKVSKTDSKTGKGIPGVSLKITGADKASPAKNIEGKPLVGADAKPAVVQTGKDGLVSVPNLAAPQDICVTETAAAPGYEFDPKKPAVACGRLEPGGVLTLSLKNTAKKVIVPVHIPAGQSPSDAVTTAAMSTQPSSGGLFGLGAGVLAFGALGTLAVRRATRKQ